MVLRQRLQVFNESRHLAGLGVADANAFLPAADFLRASIRAGLRVGHINRVVFGDINSARPAKLVPNLKQAAILVENLDPIVDAVALE
jgi:hypothetical protein